MKTIPQNVRIGLASFLASLLVSTPIIAEDIEIYKSVNLGTATVHPNIMFILDTSGSMGSTMDIDETYDPLVDYSARAGACFDNNRIYPSTTVNVSCTPTFQNNYFPKVQNQCQAMVDAFAAVGFYSATFAHWNNKKNFWGKLSSSYNANDNYIECDIDQGVHGNGGVDRYIDISGAGPYTSDATGSTSSWTSIESDTVTMYDGNYMNYRVTSVKVVSTRFNVMRDVILNIIYGIDGVNVGLMRYDSDKAEGGSVRYPVQSVTATRNNMKAEMLSWSAAGFTPLSETLYEAYLYFSGGLVDYGKFAKPSSVGDSLIQGDPKHYASPVDPDFAGCQKQFIIYLSDGQPTRDVSAEPKIEALPGFVSTNGSTTDCSGLGDGSCLDDLAGYMNKHGFDVYTADKTIKDVRLTTYTIGFAEDIKLLNDAAKEGGGEYFVAYGATDLLNTINAILREIKAIHTTFSSPAVSINAFNRTTHRDDLYFTLFKPDVKTHWDGNFKRFKLDFDISGNPEIQDVTGQPAVSAITGFFKDTSQSWWSDGVDGHITEKGGAASQMFTGTTFSTGRQVYSNVSTNATLSASANWVEPGNGNITLDLLGIPAQTAAYRETLLEWARGVDVKDDDDDGDVTDARRIVGDPLHAQPMLVQYDGPNDDPVVDPDITAYVATNDGYLHAIDTRTGKELFAFIPDDLLPNLNTLYLNTSPSKTYGLDGNVAAWVHDQDLDGVIESGDHAYVYVGMRRGGRNYYALDVTDRNNPKFMWKIEGGVSNALGDFTELGQTWSTPQVRKIRLGGQDKYVLIFAGGYDLDQDSVNVRTADSVGRSVYIVDAKSGELLWRAGSTGGEDLTLPEMIYSMPADPSVVDTNGDGYSDIIYTVDMGGQMFRFDINNTLGKTSGNLTDIMTGGRIADLADDTIDTNRRFYYPPAVALMKDSESSLYLSLVLSSGYRAHPMNRDVQDRIFMLKDLPINKAPTTYVTITENNSVHDLFDTTDNTIGQGADADVAIAEENLQKANGWFIDLDASIGEKSLTKALIFAGEAFITSYVPNDPSTLTEASCEPREGSGFLYHIHVGDGTPVKNYDQEVSADPENLTQEDRKVALVRSGIPADPTMIMPKEGTAICVGTECSAADTAGKHETLYWYEK